MKKKYNDDYDDEENEFDVDEPEEIQNNGSDDDWTPEMESVSISYRSMTVCSFCILHSVKLTFVF